MFPQMIHSRLLNASDNARENSALCDLFILKDNRFVSMLHGIVQVVSKDLFFPCICYAVNAIRMSLLLMLWSFSQ